MRVANHVLTVEPSEGIDFKAMLRPKALSIVPSIILIHYAVTERLDAAVAAQIAQDYYAHLTIDGENEKPQVRQLLSFNSRGSHAGESYWNGQSALNGLSVGIEISNPGPLIRGPDGKLRTTYNEKRRLETGASTPSWPEDQAIEARHSGGKAPKNWTHWAKFTATELELLTKICVALCNAYPIIAILGHDEVAPGRKFDPGPAFPMAEFRERVFALSRHS